MALTSRGLHRELNINMGSSLLFLAQTAATAPPATETPWWHILVENAFALTILFIFLTAVVSVVLKLRQKDKCLKLFHGYHVSYLTSAGQAIWGDLVVYSQGLELRFDAPHTTRRGLIKSSAILYEADIAQCVAICRIEASLSDREKRLRQKQIRRSFRPGLIRRLMRWLRNIINTLRDAFSKALSAVIGQLAKARPGSTVLTTQQTGVNEIGQTLLFAAGNAYEPILEAHVGTPVIVRVAPPAATGQPAFELPGYLVDYTDRYIAVFNVTHEPMQRIEWELSESAERPNVKVDISADELRITCTGPDVILVKEIRHGERVSRLEVPLTPGCSVCVSTDPSGGPTSLLLERTRAIDMVCPRSLATVHFGAETRARKHHRWLGLAPRQRNED